MSILGNIILNLQWSPGDLLAPYYVRLGVAASLGSHLSNDCRSALAGYIHNMVCGLGSKFLFLCDFVGSLFRPRLVFDKIIFYQYVLRAETGSVERKATP